MKAYRMDDENTIYAARDMEEAIRVYMEDTEIMPDEGYPVELSDDTLDLEIPDYDENERPTGGTTTIRAWLDAAQKPGYLAGGGW